MFTSCYCIKQFFRSVCLQKILNINVLTKTSWAGTLHLSLYVLANRIKVAIVACQAQTQIQIVYI
jgi:hypothetical protein